MLPAGSLAEPVIGLAIEVHPPVKPRDNTGSGWFSNFTNQTKFLFQSCLAPLQGGMLP
jgi:hypothetical protein